MKEALEVHAAPSLRHLDEQGHQTNTNLKMHLGAQHRGIAIQTDKAAAHVTWERPFTSGQQRGTRPLGVCELCVSLYICTARHRNGGCVHNMAFQLRIKAVYVERAAASPPSAR